MKIKVSVPATSANIGPGYDIWGMSLQIHNEFIVQPEPKVKEHHIEVNTSPMVIKTSTSDPARELRNPNDNLFIKCYEKVFLESDFEIVHIHASVSLNIPLSRGLGSSSTAIAGGLIAGNEVLRKTYGWAFSIEELFQFAVEIEGHPDNVAPAIFGGLILNVKDEKTGRYNAVKLDMKAPVCLAGVIPHITLSTEEARKVVPQSNPIATTIFQSSRTALMTHLVAKSEWSEQDKYLFGLAIDDRLHQPMRSGLIPGMTQSFSLWENQGALACYLSGAGTTLLSFWDKNADLTNVDFRSALLNNGIESTVIFPEFDNLGTTIEHIS